jgi:hypothetical protein
LSLRDVTSLQLIDGSWENVQELFDLVGRRIQKVAALSAIDEGKRIFATIVAVAILRGKFPARAAAWSLIEEKALAWLSGRCPGSEVLIDEAVRQLSQ